MLSLVMAFCMAMLVGIFALTTLSNTSISLPTSGATIQQASAIDWLQPEQVWVPDGLTILEHAAKHNGETERIYNLLLQGQCVAVAKFCGGTDLERMYVCVDPATGLVGAVFQWGDDISTGYFSRGSNHWENRIAKEKWEVCQ